MAAKHVAVDQRHRLATRIAINRTVAGVHYPVDSAAGAVLGMTLGEYIFARATGEKVPSRTFHGTRYGGDTDFHPGLVKRMLEKGTLEDGKEPVVETGEAPVVKSSILAWLWNEAKKEVANRWG